MFNKIISDSTVVASRRPRGPFLNVKVGTNKIRLAASVVARKSSLSLEIDESSRLVRLMTGSGGNKICRTNKTVSCPKGAINVLLDGQDERRIELSYNDDDGWWYGSY